MAPFSSGEKVTENEIEQATQICSNNRRLCRMRKSPDFCKNIWKTFRIVNVSNGSSASILED